MLHHLWCTLPANYLCRYGVDHPVYGEYMADHSSVALTYSTEHNFPEDDTPEVQTASAYSHCKGTCQSGICIITPRDAYCCFTEDKRDEKQPSHGYRHGRQLSLKLYGGPKPWQKSREDKEYYQDDDKYEYYGEEGKKFHCWQHQY